MRVSELMTKNVVTVGINESCAAAARSMWDWDCGALPVIADNGERVVGMITDRDICMAAWSQNASPAEIRVANAVSKELHSCTPQDDITKAEALMRSKQVRRIPVLDVQHKLVGMLSLADIARSRDPSGASKVAPQEVASTLAGICQPASLLSASASASSTASAAL